MRKNMQFIAGLVLLLMVSGVAATTATGGSEKLFGYREVVNTDLSLFPQWLSVLERHIKETTPKGSCESTKFNQCHLKEWRDFLARLKPLPPAEQIKQVNLYANKKPYVLDIENYGVADYWATPLEFLAHNGDCEDYAIFKMLSLKQLGFPVDDMRIVIVQDTNLRIAHAVMSLKRNGDILILDNQIPQVISHKDIFHYVPIYSLNEKHWWMHLPN
jgi:predicted transglutaminase-like cysteine proteinase